MKILAFFFTALCIVGCGTYHRCDGPFWIQDEVHAADFTFDPETAWLTPKNVLVDSSGLKINPARVDRIVDEVISCLTKTFPDGHLPQTVTANCIADHFALPCPRECTAIKIIDNWFLSDYEWEGSKQQLIPGWEGWGCTEKGLPPGPCYRRSGIISGDTIIVPPSMYLLKQSLVELYTNCPDPWDSPDLAACMIPTTGPLDDGTGP